MKEKELRRYSRIVVDGVEHAPSRAMLRAVGFTEADFQRPQILSLIHISEPTRLC